MNNFTPEQTKVIENAMKELVEDGGTLKDVLDATTYIFTFYGMPATEAEEAVKTWFKENNYE